MKISFLGDISLNDNYIRMFNDGLHVFKTLEPLLDSCDFIVGNLECLAKGENGENELKKPRLTTTVETLNFLQDLQLKVACLAHNHVFDHLEDGFRKTTEFLDSKGIQHLGASLSPEKAIEPVILTKNETTIGLLNYVTKDTNPNLPEDAKVFVNYFNLASAIEDLKVLRGNVDHKVVLLHWGGRVGGGLFPDWEQPKIAHMLIDAGADLIIGHHSHTFQPFEVYHGKYIFYSLGNFCFSDFSYNEVLRPISFRERITSIIEITFEKKKYKVSLHFFRNIGTFFNPMNKYIKIVYIRNAYFKYFLRSKIIWSFYFTYKRNFLPIILFLQRDDINFFLKLSRLSKSLKKRLVK